MRLRLATWKQATLLSMGITALVVAVPVTVVALATWQVPWFIFIRIMAIAAVIPLFIAFPISMFAMYLVKSIHETMDKLDQIVRFDPLTGIWMRSHFLAEVETMRDQGGFIVLADADRFKAINDTYGHAAGDMALKHLAKVMAEVVGAHGILGRFGGEEFAIRLPGVSRQQVELLLASLGTQLRSQAFIYNGNRIAPTVSCGVAVEDGIRSVATLLRSADECLYRAKAKGRDTFVIETEAVQQGKVA